MYFSRSFIASVLLGSAAATTHLGEKGASQTVSASEVVAAASAVSASVGPGATGGAGGMVNTHVIQVGGANGTLAFMPNNVQAQPGDLVQFQFMPKNHSVVQSTFDQPCTPIQNIMKNKTDAFFSGFMPNNRAASDTKNILTYTIRVMNTQPIWFYCGQQKHCQSGMVGAINAQTSGNKTVAAFAELAKKATENIVPASSGQTSGGLAGNSTSGTGAGAAGGAGGAGGAAGGASATASAGPATVPSSVAAPRLLEGSQSFLSLGLGAVAAFLML